MQTIPEPLFGKKQSICWLSHSEGSCFSKISSTVGKIIEGIIDYNVSFQNVFILMKASNIKKLECAVALYFVIDNFNQLQYVGSSENINHRLSCHMSEKDKIEPSDFIMVIPLDHLKIAKNWKAELRRMEKALIMAINPARNKTGYISGRKRR